MISMTKICSEMISVKKVNNDRDLHKAFEIRTKVFVDEQMVPAEEELDEFESESNHFLAFEDAQNNIPCGTARWRHTDKGIKLERFAVIAEFRSQGVGTALMEAVMKDIYSNHHTQNMQLYLHAQISAVSLYAKFGFSVTGKEFDECGITHLKMISKVDQTAKA